MGSDKPHIRVTEEQRDVLHGLKQPGESYADVLARLFDQAGVEAEDAAQTPS